MRRVVDTFFYFIFKFYFGVLGLNQEQNIQANTLDMKITLWAYWSLLSVSDSSLEIPKLFCFSYFYEDSAAVYLHLCWVMFGLCLSVTPLRLVLDSWFQFRKILWETTDEHHFILVTPMIHYNRIIRSICTIFVSQTDATAHC